MSEHNTPSAQWAELPSDTREFLQRLERDDIALLESGIELVRSSVTVGKFVRWLAISIAGGFLGALLLWEGAIKLAGWVKGAGR
ncbi:hypothetical protein FPY71_11520 [Aureimonas fodinaquatilis]|uniref:Uncharacterized protein n=1 Tax=Aureimonas fodinaquatilis TaxID=2565783 RepID=A0A5B0DW61_9HYPH|nr:hypothetical protein [Aureimonas fodinaquatilis]KAA0971067.1 hypothetical protein FPY71_11520 [Aureimonas fodinaquatilis]